MESWILLSVLFHNILGHCQRIHTSISIYLIPTVYVYTNLYSAMLHNLLFYGYVIPCPHSHFPTLVQLMGFFHKLWLNYLIRTFSSGKKNLPWRYFSHQLFNRTKNKSAVDIKLFRISRIIQNSCQTIRNLLKTFLKSWTIFLIIFHRRGIRGGVHQIY